MKGQAPDAEEIEKHMRRAIELTRINAIQTKEGGPFAAVVVKNGEIVAEGWNLVVKTHDPTAHGEVVAIRRACESMKTIDLSGCVMYTSCEPCQMCAAVIWYSRLDRVYYGNALKDTNHLFDLDVLTMEMSKLCEQRSTPYKQVMAEQARQVIEQWCQENKDDAMLNSWCQRDTTKK